MTDFKQEIIERLDKLERENRLKKQRKAIEKIYLGSVSDESGQTIDKLSDFNISFIDLLMEKNNFLQSLYIEELKNNINEYYKDVSTKKIDFESDIGFYDLIAPSEDSDNDEWEIHFTTEEQEEIFHVFFSAWSFQGVAITS